MRSGFNYRYKRPAKNRFRATLFLFIISFALLTTRLIYVQIVKHRYYSKIAGNNQGVIIPLAPQRGVILDRNMRELAINVQRNSLYAVPRHIHDKGRIAEYLASVLLRDKQEILDKISNDRMFVWISRKLPDDIAMKIKSQRLKGIGFLPESERSYPDNFLAAHVLGFVDIDNNGLEGIEKYYNRELRGTDGYRSVVVDAKRRQVGSLNDYYLPPRDGYNVVLTIDEVIQHIAEKAMLAGVNKYRPKSASVVVMDPSNGDILALCNWPSYNLNDYMNSSADSRRNRAITDIIEPGSSFKVVTAGAVIEEDIVGLEDDFYCENGVYNIEGRLLHDHRPHGTLKFKNIIEVSSNIGTVKVAEKLGREKLFRYIKLFGFGKETGIDLPGEVKGIVRDLSQWSKGSIAAIPIGQEVAATALQLVTTISCIANDGILVRPRVVRKMTDSEGALIREYEPELIRRVMSKETSMKLKKILRMVVETGTGKRAAVPKYSVAGKTGTAQRLESDGSYSHDKFNSVFIGFAPAENPRLAISIVFVEPRPYYYGGTVCAPVFSEIAGKALRYMEVEPNPPSG